MYVRSEPLKYLDVIIPRPLQRGRGGGEMSKINSKNARLARIERLLPPTPRAVTRNGDEWTFSRIHTSNSNNEEADDDDNNNDNRIVVLYNNICMRIYHITIIVNVIPRAFASLPAAAAGALCRRRPPPRPDPRVWVDGATPGRLTVVPLDAAARGSCVLRRGIGTPHVRVHGGARLVLPAAVRPVFDSSDENMNDDWQVAGAGAVRGGAVTDRGRLLRPPQRRRHNSAGDRRSR